MIGYFFLFIFLPLLIFGSFLGIQSLYGSQFHIKFYENKFVYRTLTKRKNIKLSELTKFEVILGQTREWSVSPRSRPYNWKDIKHYSEVITIFKLTYALNREVKIYKNFARFYAIERKFGKEANNIAIQQREEFERKIKELPRIFPQLIIVIKNRKQK